LKPYENIFVVQIDVSLLQMNQL